MIGSSFPSSSSHTIKIQALLNLLNGCQNTAKNIVDIKPCLISQKIHMKRVHEAGDLNTTISPCLCVGFTHLAHKKGLSSVILSFG